MTAPEIYMAKPIEFEKLKHPFPITCYEPGLGIWYQQHLHPAYLVKSDDLPDFLEVVVTEHYDRKDGQIWQAHDKETGALYGGKSYNAEAATDRVWLAKNIIVFVTQFVTQAKYDEKVADNKALLATLQEVTYAEAQKMFINRALVKSDVRFGRE